MKKKYLLRCVILALVGLVCWLGYEYISISKNNQVLKNQVNKVEIPEKVALEKGITPKEVAELKNAVDTNIKSFLKDEYAFTSNEKDVQDLLRGMFTIIGSTDIVRDEESTHVDRVEYYSKFSFDIENFGARFIGDNEKEVAFNLFVKYDGKRTELPMDFVTIVLDKDNRMTGANLYGKK